MHPDSLTFSHNDHENRDTHIFVTSPSTFLNAPSISVTTEFLALQMSIRTHTYVNEVSNLTFLLLTNIDNSAPILKAPPCSPSQRPHFGHFSFPLNDPTQCPTPQPLKSNETPITLRNVTLRILRHFVVSAYSIMRYRNLNNCFCKSLSW